MNRRRLGDSELEVSEISLGSWLTYSGGVEREHTGAKILSGYDRGSFVLATKVFFQMSETDRGLSAEQIAKQIDASR